ncbi:cytochrome C oxidase Cbb3 [Methylobacterium sp. NEAU 140]|uniref:cytochrome C oxidase Cbb3 n=1 Tax=Methylobacterium sp. NEAU 140 TaxID=3064945 RepID=UPI0027368264|nr:cytochrome C oxidase Cbb3 [Methylobacterium sp. NEAU 140]MDP4021809.1 cytochrome C oxidase Cbb3 [Methylobacterium sp. NEAU 140]
MGWPRRTLAAAGVAVLAGGAVLTFGRFSYAPVPDRADLLNPDRYPLQTAYDVLGRRVSRAEAERLKATDAGRRQLSPEAGAVAIDEALVERGRQAFYGETFGNEVFLTDVMGMLDGGLTPKEVALAVARLRGAGTNNLQVAMARDVRVGDRVYRTGELIPTGLDVPRGGSFVLGIRAFYDRGHLRMGITCALCHAAVDPGTGKVVEGAPNADLNAGLLLALAKNSSAYFMHASVPEADASKSWDPKSWDPKSGDPKSGDPKSGDPKSGDPKSGDPKSGNPKSGNPKSGDPDHTGATGTGPALPDAATVEAATKVHVASWPPGSFDSSADRVTNPTSIPSSFSAHGEPYSWSGREAVGPFGGLSSLNNNVHAANSDTTQLAAAAPWLFGMDPERYLGIVLRGAATPAFRYDPAGARKPSEVLASVDPTPGSPGLNSYATLPTYPATNYMTDNGMFASVPGEPANHANNAMSAFQNLLRPPADGGDPAAAKAGRAVFEQAGCAGCHSGPALTNHRVIPEEEIGTEPTRAVAGAKMGARLSEPAMFATDTPFPLPPNPTIVPIPLEGDRLAQVQLAWGQAGTRGGYKVPNLVGLAWSAPYLHDAGVAVGPDAERQLGVPGTLGRGVAPDPANSLRALVDRDLRARVIAANRASATGRTARVTGEGHAYWADAGAGFSPADQGALVAYLLSVDRLTEAAPTP